MSTKILVAGDVRGQLDQLYARVSLVNSKHGPFKCLFCVGDFLGDAEAAEAAVAPYRSGAATVPLKTYFLSSTGDAASLPALLAEVAGGGEVAPGLVFLGLAGIAQVAGLSVAYLSGEADDMPTSDLRALAQAPGFRGVDLLLTSPWPRGAFRQLDEGALSADLLPDRDLHEVGLEALAELAVLLRPRYHFAATENQFWQRPPYRHSAATTMLCRFIALAAVQADKKQKWLHALSLAPAPVEGAPLPPEPPGTTSCPYPYGKPSASAAGGGAAADGAEPQAKRQKKEFVKDTRGWIADNCWFCMASPNFEAHLVASVADECYLAQAKGPLVPEHCLVIPLSHKACSLQLNAEDAAEVDKYVAALRKCFNDQDQEVVFFERYVGNSQFEHMHLHALPLPREAAARARSVLEQHGARVGVRFEVLPKGTVLSTVLPNVEPFLRIELPTGEQLLHRMSTNPRKHPLQYAREAFATLLGNPRRADWKVCMPVTRPGGPPLVELEGEVTEALKAVFGAYDPGAS